MAAERTLTRRATWAERVQPLTRNPGRTAAFALGGLLLVAIGARIWLSSEIVTPWIMADEFVYSEMAKSFAASGQFLVRDASTGVNNVVYPALISPAWLAHPMGTTYALAKAINRCEIPEAFMMAPAMMKSGIAINGKLVAPL